MRIIAGRLKGRALVAPQGDATRPTADRVRQALFDMLMHAPWGGRPLLDGARVLDAFAGTGALGLEALSRGAADVTFIEQDRSALAALRSNIAACHAVARVIPADARHPPPGTPCQLAFLDPPYGENLVNQAVPALRQSGWLSADTIIVAETGADERLELEMTPLAERAHGAARVWVFKMK